LTPTAANYQSVAQGQIINGTNALQCDPSGGVLGVTMLTQNGQQIVQIIQPEYQQIESTIPGERLKYFGDIFNQNFVILHSFQILFTLKKLPRKFW
jgi:hypothetical protein